MIITIDGPAAAGKGTLSRALSAKYNLAAFDTGMIYRAVGLKMILSRLDLSSQADACRLAEELTFAEMTELSSHPDFRSAIGGKAASIVSAYPSVRAALLKMQQDYALHPLFADGTPADGVVYDGRDTGTVVCPDADVKFFVTASPEVRARRRLAEFQAKNPDVTYEEVLADIKSRDARDAGRTAAPMKPAEDALIFDTSDLSIEEVIKKACEEIDNVRNKN